MPTLPALHASGSAAALRIRDHLRGLRWGVPYPLRNGILPLLRIGFRDCEAKMNGGYRRAIPYAADDSPDRLWAGSGPVRWIMRGGKPVAWQCETTIELPAEQCSVGTVRLPLSQRPLERVCGHERICISCKAHFQSNSKKTAKWCPDCRLKRQKQKQSEWEKKYRTTGKNITPKPRKCARCGAEHTSPSHRNHCKACQVIHHREQARKRAAERREEAKGEI